MYLGENRLWVPLLGGKSLPWRVVRPIAGDDTNHPRGNLVLKNLNYKILLGGGITRFKVYPKFKC